MIETILSLIMALGIGLSFYVPSPTQVKEVYSQGKSFLVTGNYQQAEKYFRWIVDVQSPLLNKDSILIDLQDEMEIGVVNASHYQLGNLYKKTGKEEDAIREFSIVADEAESEKLRIFSRYQIILTYYNSGNYKEAIQAADKLLSNFTDPVYRQKALYNKAWAYYKLEDYSQAAGFFDTLATKYPDSKYSPRALFQEGQILYDTEKYAEAAETFFRLIKAYAPREFTEKDWSKIELKKLRRIQQKASMQDKNLEEEELVELIAKAYLKAGECYGKAGNNEQAYAMFREVTQRFVPLQEMVETAFLHMAEIKFDEEGIDAAIDIYQKALEASEKRDFKARMQYQKAKLYQEKGYYDQAIREYRIYLKGFDDVAVSIGFPVSHAYYQMGETYYAAGVFKEAARYYSMVADSFPDAVVAPNSLYNLALSQNEMDQTAMAIVTLDTLKTRYPNSPIVPNAVFQQARFFTETDDFASAISNYQFLIDNDSLFPGFDQDLAYIDLGLLYKDLKKHEKALKTLSEVKSGSPYYPGACSAISEIYLSTDRADSAVIVLTNAISTLSDSSIIAEFRYYLARVYIQMKNYPEALDEFSYAIEHTDKEEIRASSLYGRGFILFEQQNYDAAIDDFMSLLKMKTSVTLTDKAREKLIFALINAARAEESMGLLRDWIGNAEIPERKAKLYLLLMQAYNRMGKYERAIAVSDTILAMDIEDKSKVEALFYKGSAYFQSGDYLNARVVFSLSLEKYPQNAFRAQFLYQLGMCDYLLGEYPSSAEIFSQFIREYQEDPNLEFAYYYRAFSFMNTGEWKQARDEFEALLARFPDTKLSAEIHYQIAETYYNTREYKKAREKYEKVVNKFPQSSFEVQSLYNIAWCLYQLDSTDMAMKYFQKIVADFPGSEYAPFAQYTLGDYFYNRKEYNRAIEAYRVVVNRYPDSELAPKAESTIHEIRQINSYLEYQEAMKLFDNKQYEEAISALEKVIEKYPEADVRVGAMVNVGAAWEQLGNYEMALRAYDRVLELFANNPSAGDVVQFAEQHMEYIKSNY